MPYALIAPIALLLLAISFYPALYAVWLAMTDASLLRLARAQFIGLAEFRPPGRRPIFLDGLWRTLRWDVAVVLLELAIALPIALFLNLSFRGRGFVRAAVMVPYIMPPAVAALLCVYMFDGNFGVANDILVRLGVLDHYVSWLSDPTASFVIVVVAMVWAGTPLMALILLAALQTIPGELYEAAGSTAPVPGSASGTSRCRISCRRSCSSAAAHDLDVEPHRHDLHHDARRPGLRQLHRGGLQLHAHQQFEIGYSSAVAVVLAIILMTASALLRAPSRAHGAGMTNTAVAAHAPRSSSARRRPRLFARAVPLDLDRLDHARDQGRLRQGPG